jgi:4-hydroxy-tetrahydrodipicolinate synthase
VYIVLIAEKKYKILEGKMISGSLVAIITPFKKNKIDEQTLTELIDFQIEGGTHGIVPCGTTGESPTLSYEEHKGVIKHTIEVVDKRVPVVAGTGSNSTDEAINLTRYAEQAGADAALVIVPYYNKPTQEGIFQHFKSIAANTDIPIILYNVPGRTGVNMETETVARLRSSSKNIIGIKEASGSITQASNILSQCGKDFLLLSGEDALNYPLLTIGARGFITVTANIVPNDVAELYNRFVAGDYSACKELHYKLLPLNEALFLETNPIPVKRALALMNKIEMGCRLPLCEMSKTHLDKLKSALKNYGLTD